MESLRGIDLFRGPPMKTTEVRLTYEGFGVGRAFIKVHAIAESRLCLRSCVRIESFLRNPIQMKGVVASIGFTAFMSPAGQTTSLATELN
eukprot:656201-Amphidinium_carterae.1